MPLLPCGTITLTALAVVLSYSVVAVSASQGPVANTTNGPVEGIAQRPPGAAGEVYSWRGIPYAEPPIGHRRFAKPERLAKTWASPRNATVFTPGCMAFCWAPANPWFNCAKDLSEDCLHLNVYAPKSVFDNRHNASVGVLVWIHGGFFNLGTAMAPIYDGTGLAAQSNTIVVAINYRLNVFGGLFTGTVRGNFHMQDQRMALKWVQDNIHHFGGNPNKVTISGQSAGAASVGYHMITPKSYPLFQQAIMRSNPAGVLALKPYLAIKLGERLLHNVSCPSGGELELECLRKVPADVLLQASALTFTPSEGVKIGGVEQWLPVVDGPELPQDMFTALARGNFSKVPTMLGTVRDEMMGLTYMKYPKLSYEIVEFAIAFLFGNLLSNITALYNATPGMADYRPLFAQLQTDYTFVCPTRYFADVLSSAGVPTFGYVFDFVWGDNQWYQPGVCQKYVCHQEDVIFFFGSMELVTGKLAPNVTARDRQLIASMQTEFGNFVNTGATSGQGVAWPSYAPKSGGRVYHNETAPTTNTVVEHYRTKFCDFWQKIGWTIH